MHACTHVHTHVHTHAHMHTCPHTHTHTHARTHTHTHTHGQSIVYSIIYGQRIHTEFPFAMGSEDRRVAGKAKVDLLDHASDVTRSTSDNVLGT